MCLRYSYSEVLGARQRVTYRCHAAKCARRWTSVRSSFMSSSSCFIRTSPRMWLLQCIILLHTHTHGTGTIPLWNLTLPTSSTEAVAQRSSEKKLKLVVCEWCLWCNHYVWNSCNIRCFVFTVNRSRGENTSSSYYPHVTEPSLS